MARDNNLFQLFAISQMLYDENIIIINQTKIPFFLLLCSVLSVLYPILLMSSAQRVGGLSTFFLSALSLHLSNIFVHLPSVIPVICPVASRCILILPFGVKHLQPLFCHANSHFEHGSLLTHLALFFLSKRLSRCDSEGWGFSAMSHNHFINISAHGSPIEDMVS